MDPVAVSTLPVGIQAAIYAGVALGASAVTVVGAGVFISRFWKSLSRNGAVPVTVHQMDTLTQQFATLGKELKETNERQWSAIGSQSERIARLEGGRNA